MVFASQCITIKPLRAHHGRRALRPRGGGDVILYIYLADYGIRRYGLPSVCREHDPLGLGGGDDGLQHEHRCGARGGGEIARTRRRSTICGGRERVPQGADFEAAVSRWRELYSDPDARFDKGEYRFDAADIAPMITYGTNAPMGMAIDGEIPAAADPKALEYMGFQAGERMLGKPVDYVFVGRHERTIQGPAALRPTGQGARRKAEGVTAGSSRLEGRGGSGTGEGLDTILAEAGLELRQPGCSACLVMNADDPGGKLAAFRLRTPSRSSGSRCADGCLRA